MRYNPLNVFSIIPYNHDLHISPSTTLKGEILHLMPLHQTLGSLHGVRMVAGAGLHRACRTRRASPEPPWTGLGNLQFCSGKCTSYDQNWGKDWELSIHQILGIEWLFFVQNGPSGDFTGWLRKRAVADYWHLGW